MKELIAISICSGIEAASVAAEGLPIKVIAVAEIDKFPSAVLKFRYPDKPNFGDFTKITKEMLYEKTGHSNVDILIGGTPCQSFSIAGLRKGLESENGNLALEFFKLAARLRPRWIVWENVPGVFSSNGGRDFASFLGGLTGKRITPPGSGKWQNSGVIQGIPAAYSIAWRVLDAEFAGVPQRRRRVFVVGHIGADWRRAAAVLLERHSLQGHSPPSRETGKGIAGSVAGGVGSSYCVRTNQTGSNGSNIKKECALTVDCAGSDSVIAFTQNTRDEVRDGKFAAGFKGKQSAQARGIGFQEETAPTLETDGVPEVVIQEGMKQRTYLAQQAKECDISPTLDTMAKDRPIRNQEGIIVYNIMPQNSGKDYKAKETETAQNLTTNGNHSGNQGGTYVASTGAGYWNQGDESGTIRAREQEGHEHLICNNISPTLNAAFGQKLGLYNQHIDSGAGLFIKTKSTVRRLTPTEAARLQGFPDKWTQIPWRSGKIPVSRIKEEGFEIKPEDALEVMGRVNSGEYANSMELTGEVSKNNPGKPVAMYGSVINQCPDGPQYKCYGNSMAVPVIRWIWERILKIEELGRARRSQALSRSGAEPAIKRK